MTLQSTTDSARSSPAEDSAQARRTRRRLYAICALLLLASAINYMDRQTLSAASPRITQEFQLSELEYGGLEASFGRGFAFGSLAFGILVDLYSVRWLYPAVLLLWSAAGFLTGFADDYGELLACRGFLGFFEAAHWPCALKTTQALLSPDHRAMGNSVLQSGTSIGAILTPLLMLTLLTPEPGSWRVGFQIIGAMGLAWIVGWLAIVRAADWHPPSVRNETGEKSLMILFRELWTRKFLVLLVVVTVINASWQVLRAWLPKVLIQGRGYAESEALLFQSLWFVATDIGCFLSGAIALSLVWRGWSIKSSRLVAFGCCTLACVLLVTLPGLSKGWLLLSVLLLAGAGAMGMFPLYYSFSQDISRVHQGKVTGITGIIAWLFVDPVQRGFGWLADTTGSYEIGFAIAGFLPVIAWLSLVVFWPNDKNPT